MNLKILITVVCMSIYFSSCSGDDDSVPTSELELQLVGLEELSSNAKYEAWITVEGTPKSVGTFTNLSGGNRTFSAPTKDLEIATEFFITIEFANDNDDSPSNTILSSGKFTNNVATLDSESSVANFDNISGKFTLATPTDDPENTQNDRFGIWFEDRDGIQVNPGLVLPMLSNGWKYEAWVMFGDIPVNTGTFSVTDAADDASPFSGNGASPPFPGEDFLNTAPAGLNFTQDSDVRGKMVFVTIEPSPDFDQSAPFYIQLLSGTAGQSTAPSVNTLDVVSNGEFPLGRVTRKL